MVTYAVSTKVCLFSLYRAKSVCYEVHGVDLGCFDDNPPFDDLPLPWSLEDINPAFYLFSPLNKDQPVPLDLHLPIP